MLVVLENQMEIASNVFLGTSFIESSSVRSQGYRGQKIQDLERCNGICHLG